MCLCLFAAHRDPTASLIARCLHTVCFALMIFFVRCSSLARCLLADRLLLVICSAPDAYTSLSYPHTSLVSTRHVRVPFHAGLSHAVPPPSSVLVVVHTFFSCTFVSLMNSLHSSFVGLDLSFKRHIVIHLTGVVSPLKVNLLVVVWVLSPRTAKVDALEQAFERPWPLHVLFSVNVLCSF